MLRMLCNFAFVPRREDQSVWERRAPLAPQHVRKLVKKGIKVIVQPSNRRAYPAQSYQQVCSYVQIQYAGKYVG